MSGDVHVRICEHLGGRFPGVTRRVLFSDSKQELWEWKKAIDQFLEQYRLILNPQRTELYPSKEGKCFLGQKVFQSHRLLPADNVRRAKRRIQCALIAKPDNIRQILSGWVGHARQADTRNLLRLISGRILSGYSLQKKHTSISCRGSLLNTSDFLYYSK